MNTLQSLSSLTKIVHTMAGYGPEDYRETEEAVMRGLHLARCDLVTHPRCPVCGSIDINASGVCTHCGQKVSE